MLKNHEVTRESAAADLSARLLGAVVGTGVINPTVDLCRAGMEPGDAEYIRNELNAITEKAAAYAGSMTPDEVADELNRQMADCIARCCGLFLRRAVEGR